ncbi:hypothetical protein Q5752_002026 [Cryptotrichosporon argae]
MAPQTLTPARACKLCHGPLASASSTAPLALASPLRAEFPARVDCHANCMMFACPGCVAADRPAYALINLNNHVYDYQCGVCMAEVPCLARRALPAPATPSLTVPSY